MIKDEISDNNNQCENVESITEEKVREDYVECVSEDDLCDVGGGTTLSSSEVQERLKHVKFKGDPKIVPMVAYGMVEPDYPLTKVPIVEYGGPKAFENKELNDLIDNESTKEE